MQWEFKESIHCQLFAEHKNTWKSVNSTLIQCIRDKLWLGHREAAPCFAFHCCWGVRPRHFLGSSSCYPRRNLSQRGTPSNILQLGRVSSKCCLVAAVNTPFLGPCGLQHPPLFSEAVPELRELFGRDIREDIINLTTAWILRSLSTLMA